MRLREAPGRTNGRPANAGGPPVNAGRAGVAAAGDWESAEDTVRTFVRVAWPLLLFVAVAALLERQWRPTPERPSPSVTVYGAIPALLYIGVAALYVFQSWPEV